MAAASYGDDLVSAPVIDRPAPPPPDKADLPEASRLSRLLAWRPTRRHLKGAARILLAYLAALVIFGAFVSVRHVNPLTMYHSIWTSTITNRYGFGQVLVKTAPFILAALAVTVPAVRQGIEDELVDADVADLQLGAEGDGGAEQVGAGMRAIR